MKKAALFVLMAFLMILTVGCSSKFNNAQQEQSAPAPQSDTDSGGLKAPQSKSDGGAQAIGDGEKQQKKSQPVEKELISVQTPLLDKRSGRLRNIKLAINQINGYTLEPGQEFSFNEIVGERTVNKGYQIAIVFIKNNKEKEVGGGICQVSSTLHAAAKYANLEITERHTHQLPVDYINSDDDATVYFGRLDLKFKNNTPHPIKIYMLLEKDDILVTMNSILT